MNSGRFPLIGIMAITLSCLLFGTAFAGFFGGEDNGKSGLDFTGGYDINTVSTMSGRVVSLPQSVAKESVIVEIRSGHETLNIFVGPRSYWEKKGIAINLNDELTVKGSKAQGHDGKSYVLAQKVVNRSTGIQVDLRNEKGEPGWAGRNMSSTRTENSSGTMNSQHSL